jgi:hypothetical protein
MDRHDREVTKHRVNQSPSDIFRYPTRAEILKARAEQQAQAQEQNQAEEISYKDEDLSGCLSGFLKPTPIAPPPQQPKLVDISYKDEDLSGCLSGFLKLQPTQPKTSQCARVAPNQRNTNTGEINPIDRDDLSVTLTQLDEEKSGWLYFN